MSTGIFGDLFQFIRNGMNVKQDKSGNGLPISRIETIADGNIDLRRVGFAGLSVNDARGWLLEEGDILFSHINSVEHIGKCAIYRGQPTQLVHGMNLLNLRCDRQKVAPEYIKHLIRSHGFRSLLAAFINKAVNQASVSIGNLRTIPVAVPSLTEQRHIAAILDQADVLGTQRREALAELGKLGKSVFVEMFGDPQLASARWECRPLKELGKVATGKTPPSAKEGMFGGETPFVTPGDLDSDVTSKRTLTAEGAREVTTVRAGSALVCCIGTIGKMGIARARSAFNQQINAVEWYELVDDRYGLAALQFLRAQFANLAASTTVPILNKSTFEKFSIPVPPIAMQQDYSRRLQAVEVLKGLRHDALVESDDLFASLRQRAFNGELRPVLS